MAILTKEKYDVLREMLEMVEDIRRSLKGNHEAQAKTVRDPNPFIATFVNPETLSTFSPISPIPPKKPPDPPDFNQSDMILATKAAPRMIETSSLPNFTSKTGTNNLSRKYSCEEIYERMEMGLCVFCDELDTPGHHLRHKKSRIFMIESGDNQVPYDKAVDEVDVEGIIDADDKMRLKQVGYGSESENDHIGSESVAGNSTNWNSIQSSYNWYNLSIKTRMLPLDFSDLVFGVLFIYEIAETFEKLAKTWQFKFKASSELEVYRHRNSTNQKLRVMYQCIEMESSWFKKLHEMGLSMSLQKNPELVTPLVKETQDWIVKPKIQVCYVLSLASWNGLEIYGCKYKKQMLMPVKQCYRVWECGGFLATNVYYKWWFILVLAVFSRYSGFDWLLSFICNEAVKESKPARIQEHFERDNDKEGREKLQVLRKEIIVSLDTTHMVRRCSLHAKSCREMKRKVQTVLNTRQTKLCKRSKEKYLELEDPVRRVALLLLPAIHKAHVSTKSLSALHLVNAIAFERTIVMHVTHTVSDLVMLGLLGSEWWILNEVVISGYIMHRRVPFSLQGLFQASLPHYDRRQWLVQILLRHVHDRLKKHKLIKDWHSKYKQPAIMNSVEQGCIEFSVCPTHLKKQLAAKEGLSQEISEVLKKIIAGVQCLKHISLQQDEVLTRTPLEYLFGTEQYVTSGLVKDDNWQAVHDWFTSLQESQAVPNCEEVDLVIKGEDDVPLVFTESLTPIKDDNTAGPDATLERKMFQHHNNSVTKVPAQWKEHPPDQTTWAFSQAHIDDQSRDYGFSEILAQWKWYPP